MNITTLECRSGCATRYFATKESAANERRAHRDITGHYCLASTIEVEA